MDDQLVIDRILDRIDAFDEKLDTNITELKKDMTTCKLDIQAVKIGFNNHIDNKKAKSKKSNRQFYIIVAILGVVFTTYATLKELF